MIRLTDRIIWFLGLLFLLFYVVLPMAGYEALSVMSGSMSPAVNAGDMVYLKSINADDIEIGDVMAFFLTEKQLVLHRVIRKEGKQLITKGDANETEDFLPVRPEQIYGKMVFHIPYGAGIIRQICQIKTGVVLCLYILLRIVLTKIRKR